jgi:hypothetical protein
MVAWSSGWGVYGVPGRTLGGRVARRWGGGLRRCDGDRQSIKLAKGHNVLKGTPGSDRRLQYTKIRTRRPPWVRLGLQLTKQRGPFSLPPT